MSNAQVLVQTPLYGEVTANNGAAVPVALPAINTSSVVLLSLKAGAAAGANAGAAKVTSVTAGTGFSITGGAADTSVYKYLVF